MSDNTPYYSEAQLDALSKEIRTIPVDGDGQALTIAYDEHYIRNIVSKLIHDARRASSLQAQLDAKDTEIAQERQGRLLKSEECEHLRNMVESWERKHARLSEQIAERDATIAKMAEVPGYGTILMLREKAERVDKVELELAAKNAVLEMFTLPVRELDKLLLRFRHVHGYGMDGSDWMAYEANKVLDRFRKDPPLRQEEMAE